MSKPTLADIAAGSLSWDATINSNKDKLVGGPFPVKEYADAAALPSAALNDRCIAATLNPIGLWLSTGASWIPIGVHRATTLITLTGTLTWTGAYPAGVRQLGVSGRVTTAATGSGGATSIIVGDHGASDPDRYAAGIAFALGTTFADVATADPGGWNSGARDVVVAPNAGSFTAGALRLWSHFLSCPAPTS